MRVNALRSLAVLGTLLLGLSAVFFSWAEDKSDQTDLSHLLRIQVSVEFDGERIDFDDTIFCGARVKGTLTSRPVTQVLPSRFRISHPTKDGGLLSYPVSWILCSLGQSTWRSGKTTDNEFTAPEGYLPPILWVDTVDPEERTFGEEYVSEAAFEAPGARLKILSPMQFSIPEHPPSKEAIEKAFRAEDIEHALTNPLGVVPDGYIVEFPYNEWNSHLKGLGSPASDELLSFLEALPVGQGIIRLNSDGSAIEKSLNGAFSNLFGSKRIYHTSIKKYGVPRREMDRYGQLLERPENVIIWPDRAVPLQCLQGGGLRPDYAKTGMVYWRPIRCANSKYADWIELEGQILPLDRKTWSVKKAIYYSKGTRSIFVRYFS